MTFDYTIKNFRAFDSKGAAFTISPLTILTGTNSSGKSSMAKSFLLLRNYLKTLQTAAKSGNCIPARIPFDFSSRETQLGSFEKNLNVRSLIEKETCLRNNEEIDPDSNTITFEYKTYSKFLHQDCSAELKIKQFDDPDEGMARYGWLSHMRLSSLDGGFSIDIEFINGQPIIREFNRVGIKKAFMKALCFEKYSRDLPYLASSQGFITEKTNNGTPHEFDFLVKGAPFPRDLTQQEFNDFMSSHPGLSSIPDDVLSGVISASAINYIPGIEELKILSLAELEGLLRTLDASDSWQACINLLVSEMKSHNVSTVDELYRIKERFWLSDSSWPIHEPATVHLDYSGIRRDLFQELREILQVDPYMYRRNVEYINQRGFDYPLLVSILRRHSRQQFDSDRIDVYMEFQRFCEVVVQEVLFPSFIENASYINSTRATVKRVYPLNDNLDSFENLLSRYFVLKNDLPKNKGFKDGEFINHWIDEDRPDSFQIGKKIAFDEVAEGAAIVPFVFRMKKKPQELALADMGYGVTQLLSILINIEVVVMENILKWNNPQKPSYIVIEEPEIHLHPRLQSILADMFLDAYLKYNIHFIIETHSEYLVRRTQVLVSQMAHDENKDIDALNREFKVYYFTEGALPYCMEYRRTGQFEHQFGPGFFDEAGKNYRALLERSL